MSNKIKITKSKIFVIILSFFVMAPALAYYNPGKPAGLVNDYAGMMSESEKQSLETKLVNFESQTSNEIAVVTIPSLDGDTIENFAVRLFEEWKIGKAKNDNGILLLIAKEDRQMRIEVGYGLEGALTDAQSFWIIDGIMKPAFRQEKYYEGIDQAVDKIMAATQGEYIPESQASKPSGGFDWETIFWLGLFVVIWLASILGRSKSWWAGGVIGAIIGVIFGVGVFGLIGVLIGPALGVFLFDLLSRREIKKSSKVATYTFFSTVAGIVINLVLAVLMIGIFVGAIFV